MGINAIFFMALDFFLPSDIASACSVSLVLLAIMHPENKTDRDAIKLPVIDVILEK